MIDLILQMPIEIKAIMGLLQYRKDKVWEKQQQKNHR